MGDSLTKLLKQSLSESLCMVLKLKPFVLLGILVFSWLSKLKVIILRVILVFLQVSEAETLRETPLPRAPGTRWSLVSGAGTFRETPPPGRLGPPGV